MKYIEMVQTAKIAVAGIELMTEIIDKVNVRRPDIVEDATEKTLGINHETTDAAFSTTMAKRAESVTAFDEYEDRVAKLEAALEKVRTLAQTPIHDGPIKVMTTRFDIADVCREVLKSC